MKSVSILFIISLVSFWSLGQNIVQTGKQAKIELFENSFDVFHYVIKNESPPTIFDRMKYYKVPGVSVAVIRNYQIEWVKNYGLSDIDSPNPVTDSTMFQIGSLSKTFNAMALLKLSQERKIDLDADVNEFLKTWKLAAATPNKYKVTTRHLLTHTGGISVAGFPGYYSNERIPTIYELLDGIPPAMNLPVRVFGTPGKKYRYSGGGILIAQLMLSDVEGSRYSDWMQSNIFRTLKMSRTSYSVPLYKDDLQFSTGHNFEGKPLDAKYFVYPEAPGGLWSTTTDIANFLIEIQLSLEGKSNRILSREITKEMLKPYKGTSASMGFYIREINGRKYFEHSGATAGFRSKICCSLENGNGVVVLTNSNNGALLDEIIQSVAKVYEWDGFDKYRKEIKEQRTITVSNDSLSRFEGLYRNDYEIIKIVRRNNDLWYQGFEGGGENAWRINFSSRDTFFNRESRALKRFTFDKTNNVTGFQKIVNNKNVGVFTKINSVKVQPSRLSKYEGKYKLWDVIAEIKQHDSRLFLKVANGYELELNFISENEFFVLSEEIYKEVFEFKLNSKNEVIGIIEKRPEGNIEVEKIF
jgi:CubicO group peptidase (beta-lactamase class C family)